VGLERGPLSLVSTIEELLGRKSSGSGLADSGHGVSFGVLYVFKIVIYDPLREWAWIIIIIIISEYSSSLCNYLKSIDFKIF
jgi:hypothetical protein